MNKKRLAQMLLIFAAIFNVGAYWLYAHYDLPRPWPVLIVAVICVGMAVWAEKQKG